MKQFFRSLIGTSQPADNIVPVIPNKRGPLTAGAEKNLTFSEIYDDIFIHGPARRTEQSERLAAQPAKAAVVSAASAAEVASHFDLDGFAMVTPDAKTSAAVAFLGQFHELIEGLGRDERQAMQRKNKVHILNDQPPLNQERELRRIKHAGQDAWKKAIERTLQRYGEAACTNAIFQLGDPEF